MNRGGLQFDGGGFRQRTAPMRQHEVLASAVTETCFLIQRAGGRPADVIRKIVERNLEIGIDLADDASAIESLMQRYADTSMSLADACLVRLT